MKYQLLERNDRNVVEEGSSERKMTNFLETISEPGDVQHLNLDQLESLAEECRQRIIEVTSKCGGHLASSLGAVEITLALVKLYDLKKDRLVWDVGHQAYTHKLLTGRSQQFETLAQSKGVKSFYPGMKVTMTISGQVMHRLPSPLLLAWPSPGIYRNIQTVSWPSLETEP